MKGLESRTGSGAPAADGVMRVFLARKIITMDPANPTATAVAVKDGKVVSVGTVESLRPWLGRNSHEIDRTFEDKVLLPGFIDPHVHPEFGIALALPHVGYFDSATPGGGVRKGLKDKAAVIARLKELDAQLENPEEPVMVFGYDDPFQGGPLTKADLDQVSGVRPVLVLQHTGHAAYVNSALLRLAGITRRTDVDGVRKGPDGEPDGRLVEWEAEGLVLGPLSRWLFGSGNAEKGIWYAAALAHEAGVTTMSDMLFRGAASPQNPVWNALQVVNHPRFPQRVQLVCDADHALKTQGENAVRFVKDQQRHDTEKLFFNHVKLIVDGAFAVGTLRLKYPGLLEGGNGLWQIPPEELPGRLMPFWKGGLDIHVHSSGDEATEAVLAALKALQAECPRMDHRFTIEHYLVTTPEQARTLRELGGLASVTISFLHSRGERFQEQFLGPDRANRIALVGSLARNGVPFAFHSDLPMAPAQPLLAVWTAVNRFGLSGKVLAPEERISLDEALKAITINAAYVIRLEDRLGSIEPAKLADFTVLEEDPYAVPKEKIKDIPVWGTVLGGTLLPVER